MPLTPNQEQAVECHDRPLFIQAGAGTGKTFTLTKKLAYALSPKSGPLLSSVNSVLTITFTNKAAAELLGRVRGELRTEGLKEAAQEVDAAWISTIHSMCKNILSAHAMEAGVVPGCALLSQEESDELMGRALDDLLQDGGLHDELDYLSATYDTANLCILISKLARVLALAPEGIATFQVGPQPDESPLAHVRCARVELAGALGSLEELGVREAPSAACQKQLDRLEAFIAACDGLLAKGVFSWDDAADALEPCPLPKGGNLKKAFREDFAQATQSAVQLRMSVAAAQAYYRLEAACKLAQWVGHRHAALKLAQGSQDTDDLLIATYKLLESHPSIAQEYRQRFGAVMVDEFQDTDSLQVQIVESFCDERLSTLTTVGDAQQSIYGFRGADLETYRAVRQQMRSCGSCEVKLDTNYRSHPDILAFVEAIFSAPEFFGDEFLRIGAGEANARSLPWVAADDTRVQVLLAAGSKGEGSSHTSARDLRQAEAEMIAERFEELASRGAAYGDMAILMYSTKAAAPYLKALRDRGIPCALYGGSDFYLLPETRVLVALLRVLELPDDEGPLLELLGSPLFDIPDDDLMALRYISRFDLEKHLLDPRPKVTLWDALRHQAKKLPYNSLDPLTRAFYILDTALRQRPSLPLSSIVEQVIQSSGWLDALREQGAQGEAVRANLLRFEDLMDEYQTAQGFSVLGTAEHFRQMCDMAQAGVGAKGKPGKMVGLGSDAVQVMTIHASKGLEFPIVAVVQYARKTQGGSGLLTLTEQGQRYLLLNSSVNGESSTDVKAALAAAGEEASGFDSAQDTAAFLGYASQLNSEREAEEAQRLLYVALTRARDMLILASNDATYASKGELGKGLFKDIVQAVCPGGLPQGDAVRKLDTGCLVEFHTKEVPCGQPDEAAAQDEDLPGRLESSHVSAPLLSQSQLVNRVEKRRAIKSYSALEAEGEGHKTSGVPCLRNREDEKAMVSPVGSAFHLVAQWIALQDCDAQELEPQLSERIAAAKNCFGLDDEDMQRLTIAVQQWVASSLYAQTLLYSRRLPEQAFCFNVGDVLVEGYIDLLCLNDDSQDEALIVDYKTGTSGDVDELQDRYLLQAQTYAAAVLQSRDCASVRLVFVRPEANLQQIEYVFGRKDLPKIKEFLAQRANL